MNRRIITVMVICCMTICTVSAPVLASEQNTGIIDEVVLEPKDPVMATVLAFGPGLAVHGWGNLYAEDFNMGLTLLGVEILSIGAMTLGYIINTDPDLTEIYGGNNDDDRRRGGAITFAFGFVFFLASWMADIVQAGKKAEQYNKEHNLEFRMQQESYLHGNTDTIYAAVYNIRF
ncbi:MAG: hypothetical protein LLG37_10265 [Spirochaetia bacterium]|nr:hypothetical protein [Spirochaetia bacterium]